MMKPRTPKYIYIRDETLSICVHRSPIKILVTKLLACWYIHSTQLLELARRQIPLHRKKGLHQQTTELQVQLLVTGHPLSYNSYIQLSLRGFFLKP